MVDCIQSETKEHGPPNCLPASITLSALLKSLRMIHQSMVLKWMDGFLGGIGSNSGRGQIKLAPSPAAKVRAEPTRANHGQARSVPNARLMRPSGNAPPWWEKSEPARASWRSKPTTAHSCRTTRGTLHRISLDRMPIRQTQREIRLVDPVSK